MRMALTKCDICVEGSTKSMNKESSFHWPQMVGIKMSMTAMFRHNMTQPSLKLRTMAIRNTSSANGMVMTAVLAALKAASFSWYSRKWRSNVSWRHKNRVNLHVVNSRIPGSWEYLSINSCKSSSNVRSPLYLREITSMLDSIALIVLRIMVSRAWCLFVVFSSSSSCASFAQLIESMPGARFYSPNGLFNPWMGLKGVTQPNTLNSSHPPKSTLKLGNPNPIPCPESHPANSIHLHPPKPNIMSQITSTQLHPVTPTHPH